MQQFEAKEIGARIAQARKERGLTQDELAEMAVGFSKRSLQDYEAGETTPYRHLTELGRLLGRETEWFLYGDEDRGEPNEQIAQLISQISVLRETVESLRLEVVALHERATVHEPDEGQSPSAEASR